MRLEMQPAGSLMSAKEKASAGVDQAAGRIRQRYITTVPGQSDTYREKLADAQAWQAQQAPDEADHPWVVATARSRGIDPAEAAQQIISTYQAWATVGVQIEEARESGKASIQAAGSHSDVIHARNKAIAALQEFVPEST